MLKTLLATALLVSPVSAEELWSLTSTCDYPAIAVSDDMIERLDFQCSIEGVVSAGADRTYQALCQTDLPSVEPMTISFRPVDGESAVIAWGDVDTDLYYRCD